MMMMMMSNIMKCWWLWWMYDSKQKRPALHTLERTIVPRTVIFFSLELCGLIHKRPATLACLRKMKHFHFFKFVSNILVTSTCVFCDESNQIKSGKLELICFQPFGDLHFLLKVCYIRISTFLCCWLEYQPGRKVIFFGCPYSSLPTLGQWVIDKKTKRCSLTKTY